MSIRDEDRKGMDMTGVVDYGAKLDLYEWTQTRTEVTCTIRKENWPADVWDFAAHPLKVQNLEIHMTLTEIFVGIKGKPNSPLIKGKLFGRINTDDSTWTWDKDTEVLEFTLQKDMTVHDTENPWWASFIQGHEKIDVDLIEGSKYLDVSLLRRIKAEKDLKKKAEADAKAAAAAAAGADGAAATTTADATTPAAATDSQ